MLRKTAKIMMNKNMNVYLIILHFQFHNFRFSSEDNTAYKK